MCAAGYFIALPTFLVLVYLRFRPRTLFGRRLRPSRFTLLMAALVTLWLILSCHYRPTLPERPRFGLPTGHSEILLARHGPASVQTGSPETRPSSPLRNTNPRHRRALS